MNVLLIFISLLNFFCIYLFFNFDFNKNFEEYRFFELLRLNKKMIKIYSLLFSILISIFLFYDNELLNLVQLCKLSIILNILWAVSIIDLKSYRIPNIFILYGIICRILIAIFELVYFENYIYLILENIIISIAIFIIFYIFNLLLKNSIGFGDIKLLILIALYFELSYFLDLLLISIFISFLFSLFLILAKKYNKKSIIPFAPFLAMGTYLMIIFKILS